MVDKSGVERSGVEKPGGEMSFKLIVRGHFNPEFFNPRPFNPGLFNHELSEETKSFYRFWFIRNKSFTRNIERALSCVQQIFFQAKHIERRDHSPLISIYSKDWKSSRFQSKAIKTNQEEDLGRELLVKTVTRPSVRETANRSKIDPTKPASSK